MSGNPENSKVHFFNLDVLRCVCAVMVAISHSYEAFCAWIAKPAILQANPVWDKYVSTLVSNLSIGVDVFFVISGFLITYLLLLEKQKNGNIHVGKFIVRRSLRIWPLYFFAIFFGFILVQFFTDRPHPDYLANLLFLNNFNAIRINDWQFPFAHFWSICVEEHFYIVWPVLVYFTPLRQLPLMTALLIGCSLLFRYAVAYFQMEPGQMYLHMHTLARMDELLVGAVCAWIYFREPFTLNISRSIRLLVYAVFIWSLFIEGHLNWADSVFSVLFKKYFYLGFIVFWLLNYLFNPTAFFNFKSKNAIHYLGKISFGIYVYHNIILEPFISQIAYRFHLSNLLVFEVVYFAFLFVISAISFEWYEKHFLKLKDKFVIIQTSR